MYPAPMGFKVPLGLGELDAGCPRGMPSPRDNGREGRGVLTVGVLISNLAARTLLLGLFGWLPRGGAVFPHACTLLRPLVLPSTVLPGTRRRPAVCVGAQFGAGGRGTEVVFLEQGSGPGPVFRGKPYLGRLDHDRSSCTDKRRILTGQSFNRQLSQAIFTTGNFHNRQYFQKANLNRQFLNQAMFTTGNPFLSQMFSFYKRLNLETHKRYSIHFARGFLLLARGFYLKPLA